jgi:hypothetical protein
VASAARRGRARIAAATGAAFAAALLGSWAAGSQVVASGGSNIGVTDVAAECGAAVPPGEVRCFARVLTSTAQPHAGSSVVGGYSPADLQAAYGMSSATGGQGQKIGIVDVADDPNAETDLATYRQNFGLPPCTTANGCFTKAMVGAPQPNAAWSREISLDLDMASAACPNCGIVLVEVPADASGGATVPVILQGVTLAKQLGATVISLSLGSSEYSNETLSDPQLQNLGVPVVVASGDSGYGVSYPAASRFVTAVGGTTLQRAGSARGWSETAWRGTGSGCSVYEAKPTWQHDSGCGRRTTNDIALVADPATGVAVYNSFGAGGWETLGGTSVGAPLLAGMDALKGGAAAPTAGQNVYFTQLFDVVSGSNGACAPAYLCTAGIGYDGPTGMGTPAGANIGPSTPPTSGYWLVASDGGIFSFGNAVFSGSTGAIRLNQPVVGMARTLSGAGYWLVASDGGIFSFGDAVFHGSTGGIRLNQPIVAMAATPSGLGYWLVASDGGVFSFGDARFEGSTGATRLNKPIVGMASTPSGLGYWLVASDGGIFSFGDAAFQGSTGATRLNQPIVGMARTPSGLGYWLVASDGGIFSFGSAPFEGSTGAIRLNKPIVSVAATPAGLGYWLVASDGGVFSFGDAVFEGSTGGTQLNRPIQGMAATG